MRIRTLTVMALMGLGLSGCSLWTKSDSSDTSAQSDTSLRSAPQQAYQFPNQSYDVDIYDGASQYAGYAVEFYSNAPSYISQSNITQSYSDPREVEFVKLNGDSEPTDWRNCEVMNRGYLFISEYDFRLDPGFEVCMRNKGYVLSAEYGPISKQALNAKNAGLRGVFPESESVNSTYPRFFP